MQQLTLFECGVARKTMAEPITEGAGPAAEPPAVDDAGAAAAVTAVTEKKIGTPRGGIRFFLSAAQPTAGVCVLRARFPSPPLCTGGLAFPLGV
jgi:hypothetical protein